jgi:hypothetical protein
MGSNQGATGNKNVYFGGMINTLFGVLPGDVDDDEEVVVFVI